MVDDSRPQRRDRRLKKTKTRPRQQWNRVIGKDVSKNYEDRKG